MKDRNSKHSGAEMTARSRQRAWRERIPELRHVVEELSPAIWRLTREDQKKQIPAQWKDLVASLRAEVLTKAESPQVEPQTTANQRRGYEWSWKLRIVDDMLDHLMQTICTDIGFDDGAVLGSMALLRRSMLHLQLELQDGGSSRPREDTLENQYRVQQALMALNNHFDDVQMRRLRALQLAGPAAQVTRIPDEQDVETRLQAISEHQSLDAETEQKHRDSMYIDQPALSGVMVRSWLVEVDERFGSLDPLIIMEEFAEARADSDGGRIDGGEACTGPVRALARLAVLSGALDYAQKGGEDFDAAVDRARRNLISTRSRVKQAVQAFPTRLDGDDG